MKTVALVALVEAVILASILLLNPVFSNIGVVVPPDIGGSAETSFMPMPTGIPDKLTTAADIMLRFSQDADQLTQQPPSGVTFLNALEQRVFDLTNVERRKQKLTALQADNLLQKAARIHSLDMLKRQFFDHANPDGKTAQDRIAIVHRQLIGTTGENLWMQDGRDLSQVEELAKRAVADWMKSPGYRENILRQEFTHLGVGAVGEDKKLRLTQNFSSTQALLKQAINLELKLGEVLNLDTQQISQKKMPQKYAFWLPDKGILAAEPLYINDRQVNIKPGEYQLRFYFQKRRNQYLIYPGPQVLVKN